VTDDVIAIVDGESLCRADRLRVYNSSSKYVVFPPSVRGRGEKSMNDEW
jgi:hypothetical protein